MKDASDLLATMTSVVNQIKNKLHLLSALLNMQIWWLVGTGGRLWRDESFNARTSTSSKSASFTGCNKTFGW